jgi:ADP-ribosylglycohydrolase
MSAWDDAGARGLRARIALDGLSVAAALAERFTTSGPAAHAALRARVEPPASWGWPGDAELAVPTVVLLETRARIEPGELASALGARYLDDPTKSYDAMSHWTLAAIGSGMPWEDAAASATETGVPIGRSAAVRALPIGAYFAGDLDAVSRGALASAAITDPRSDGQATAVLAAYATAHAAEMGAGRAERSGEALIAKTIERSVGEQRAALSLAREALKREDGAARASKDLAASPVVYGIFCAARALIDYPEAVWASALHPEDRNTSCAVAGALVALASGDASIPRAWLLARDPIRR